MDNSGVPLGRRYLLFERIGSGAMSDVFRAMSREGGDDLAVKILRPDLASDQAVVKRFVNERVVLMHLDSPHIVRVLDMVVEADTLAIVMQRVEGGTLRDHLEACGGRLGPPEISDLGAQILEALASAHAAGVVHRDVKPENVLIDRTRPTLVALVTDFGISGMVSDMTHTRLTSVVGTARYMSPELLTEGAQATPAVDVYGAGVLLFELACGHPPFTGNELMAVLYKHVHEDPLRPDGVPDPLWELIAAMLAKNPGKRPTAAQAASALKKMHIANTDEGNTTKEVGLVGLRIYERAGEPTVDSQGSGQIDPELTKSTAATRLNEAGEAPSCSQCHRVGHYDAPEQRNKPHDTAGVVGLTVSKHSDELTCSDCEKGLDVQNGDVVGVGETLRSSPRLEQKQNSVIACDESTVFRGNSTSSEPAASDELATPTEPTPDQSLGSSAVSAEFDADVTVVRGGPRVSNVLPEEKRPPRHWRTALLVAAAIVLAGTGFEFIELQGRNSTASTINGTALSQSNLDADLAAIATSADYKCYLNSEEYLSSSGRTLLPRVSSKAFVASYLETDIGHELALQLAAERHVSVTPAGLASARAALTGQITQVMSEILQKQQGQNVAYSCRHSGQAITGQEVLESMPASFVDQQVQFVAEVTALEEDLAGVGSSPADLQNYFDSHAAKFDTVCISAAVYSSESAAQAAAASAASGTSFSTLVSDTASSGGGAQGCHSLPEWESSLPSGADLGSLATGAVSSPISVNNMYVLLQITSRTPTTYNDAKTEVANVVQQAGATATQRALAAYERRSSVSVNSIDGSWNRSSSSVIAPRAKSG